MVLGGEYLRWVFSCFLFGGSTKETYYECCPRAKCRHVVDVSPYDDAQMQEALDSGVVMFTLLPFNDNEQNLKLSIVRGVDPDKINKLDAETLRQQVKEHIKRANDLGMMLLADEIGEAEELESLKDRLEQSEQRAKSVQENAERDIAFSKKEKKTAKDKLKEVEAKNKQLKVELQHVGRLLPA